MSTKTLDYLEGFLPTPTLGEKPTHDEIVQLLKIIRKNAASVDAHNGGGNHGHLGITHTIASYGAIPGTAAWVNQPQPAELPNIPIGANAAAIRQITAQHTVNQEKYIKERAVLQALKNQVSTAVPEVHLLPILDDDVGLLNRTIPEIFDLLFSLPSVRVTPATVAARFREIETAGYSFSEEMSGLFNKVEKFKQFAIIGHDERNELFYCNMTVTMIHQTGHYNKAYHAWYLLAEAARTWTALKAHFLAAQTTARDDTNTTTAADFQAAKQAIILQALQTENELLRIETQSTRDTLSADFEAKLAAQANHFEALFANSTPPPPPPNDSAAQIARLQSQLRTLQNPRGGGRGGRRSGRDGTRTGGNRGDTSGRGTNGPHPFRVYHNDNYCWSCGYHVADNHTSQTCPRKKPGHVSTATRSNTHGGYEFGKAKVGM